MEFSFTMGVGSLRCLCIMFKVVIITSVFLVLMKRPSNYACIDEKITCLVIAATVNTAKL